MKKIITITAVCALLAICTLALFACAPASSPDDAVAALKSNGYSNASKDSLILPAAMRLAKVNGAETVVSASLSKDDKSEGIFIVYFDTAENAKNSYNALKEYFEDEDEGNDDWQFARSGKMIWYGSKAAVKAAK